MKGRSRTQRVWARIAALAVVAAFALLAAPGQASAQLGTGTNAYCSDRSPGGMTAQPIRTYVNAAVRPAYAGTVSVSMYGILDDCITEGKNQDGSATTQTSQRYQVMRVCEFHCGHNHMPPSAWRVELQARPSPNWYHVGWDGPCVAVRAAPRTSCILNTLPESTGTAVFSQQEDQQPPSPPVLTASPAPYAANLSWTRSLDNNWVGGYDVYVGNTHKARVAGDATSYKIVSLSCGTTYQVRIAAFDVKHTTDSNTVQVTTPACAAATRPRPNTVIHVKPPRTTKSRTAFFHFGYKGEVKPTKYQCKLDKRRWAKCSGVNGKRYRSLKKGYHTFRVRAGNAGGWDRTPATWRWRIR